MKNPSIIVVIAIAISVASNISAAADKTRQDIVAERGVAVMPFDLKATTHIFTKTKMGGTQKVITKKANDASQIRLTREHLKAIAAQFSEGDFSGPTHIHGAEMPGLAALKEAKPLEIKVQYREVKSGAELRYTTDNPKLVTALHEWFDAQLLDHGHDAMSGHDHLKIHPK